MASHRRRSVRIRGATDPAKGVQVQQRLKVQCFTLTSDGFGSGEGQSLERPFGHLEPRALHAWTFATATRAGDSGTRGIDDLFTRDMSTGIGAEIMGRNKFGPVRGPWDGDNWQGWWGEEPPFHTPVFVLTHYPRHPLTLSDTTFHFISATPAEALTTAKLAANGLDVRLGGGVATVREFLDADLIDALHVVVTPLVAGRGERLWHSPDELRDRFELEEILSPSGVRHLLFWR